MESTHSTSSSSLNTSDEVINLDDYGQAVQTNMVSNLPLLFADGYPTSLDKIQMSQLERFIPFMVQCSLGDMQLPIPNDCKEPEWWPEDIPFSVPIEKPARYKGNWANKLKKLVAICYEFHNSIFLLRFCENLSSYRREKLRFINNYNYTTSLYDRHDNKLLVTFRNENMVSGIYECAFWHFVYTQQKWRNPLNIQTKCSLPQFENDIYIWYPHLLWTEHACNSFGKILNFVPQLVWQFERIFVYVLLVYTLHRSSKHNLIWLSTFWCGTRRKVNTFEQMNFFLFLWAKFLMRCDLCLFFPADIR